MISALNTASTGMEAQLTQIDNISNNLANVNTNGYKRTRAEFQDLLYETLQEPGANTSAQTQAPIGIQRGMGVKVSGTQRNFEIGHPNHTARDLDMMIRGDGFFVVQLPTGQLGYKRDGAFFRNSTGRLESVDGYPIQPEITIPNTAKRVEVSEDGNVTIIVNDVDRVQIGQIQIATFVNNGGLKAVGKNTFVETEASGRPNLGVPNQDNVGGLMQGYLESSNVDVVKEMTDMISAQRAFEMNSKVVTTVDQLLQHTVNVR
jgi:flagellar basal-body rod protein FlgG